LGDPGTDVKIDLQEVKCGVLNRFVLAGDMDRWRAVVNAVMNIQVP
jgi:hypothetical protein